eukprot:8986818-Ditylum_brightwellii.AAC.1
MGPQILPWNLLGAFFCPCWQRIPPPLWENMVQLGDAYKISPETTAWELPDDATQVPPSVDPTQVEQPLV